MLLGLHQSVGMIKKSDPLIISSSRSIAWSNKDRDIAKAMISYFAFGWERTGTDSFNQMAYYIDETGKRKITLIASFLYGMSIITVYFPRTKTHTIFKITSKMANEFKKMIEWGINQQEKWTSYRDIIKNDRGELVVAEPEREWLNVIMASKMLATYQSFFQNTDSYWEPIWKDKAAFVAYKNYLKNRKKILTDDDFSQAKKLIPYFLSGWVYDKNNDVCYQVAYDSVTRTLEKIAIIDEKRKMIFFRENNVFRTRDVVKLGYSLDPEVIAYIKLLAKENMKEEFSIPSITLTVVFGAFTWLVYVPDNKKILEKLPFVLLESGFFFIYKMMFLENEDPALLNRLQFRWHDDRALFVFQAHKDFLLGKTQTVVPDSLK